MNVRTYICVIIFRYCHIVVYFIFCYRTWRNIALNGIYALTCSRFLSTSVRKSVHPVRANVVVAFPLRRRFLLFLFYHFFSFSSVNNFRIFTVRRGKTYRRVRMTNKENVLFLSLLFVMRVLAFCEITEKLSFICTYIIRVFRETNWSVKMGWVFFFIFSRFLVPLLSVLFSLQPWRIISARMVFFIVEFSGFHFNQTFVRFCVCPEAKKNLNVPCGQITCRSA